MRIVLNRYAREMQTHIKKKICYQQQRKSNIRLQSMFFIIQNTCNNIRKTSWRVETRAKQTHCFVNFLLVDHLQTTFIIWHAVSDEKEHTRKTDLIWFDYVENTMIESMQTIHKKTLKNYLQLYLKSLKEMYQTFLPCSKPQYGRQNIQNKKMNMNENYLYLSASQELTNTKNVYSIYSTQ